VFNARCERIRLRLLRLEAVRCGTIPVSTGEFALMTHSCWEIHSDIPDTVRNLLPLIPYTAYGSASDGYHREKWRPETPFCIVARSPDLAAAGQDISPTSDNYEIPLLSCVISCNSVKRRPDRYQERHRRELALCSTSYSRWNRRNNSDAYPLDVDSCIAIVHQSFV
jgi:hypothetical protein